MPQPTQSAVHTNVPLTMISVAYIQNQDNFVATKVFPLIGVDKASNVYYIYTKADWFRDEAQMRAPGTESSGSGYGLSTASYSCKTYAHHKDIPWDVRSNEDAPLNSDRDATEFVTQRLLLRLERQWATDYFTTSVWGTDKTVTFTWDDYANSDPIGDIRTGIRTVYANTGFKPNKLTVGYDVWIKLVDHPDILARINGGSSSGAPAIVTRQLVAQIFELDEIIVCGGLVNTAAEGATGVYSFVQGKHALLSYSPASPSLLTPSAGYVFYWKGISGSLGQSINLDRFPLRQLKVDRVEGEMSFDNKAVATDLGYFFPSVVA